MNKSISIHIVFWLFLFLACVPEQTQVEGHPYLIAEEEAPLIIAHGGLKQLFPENTMMAFQRAAQLGVDALEMDISLTKDEILIPHHDETIDRMSDGSGKVSDYTFEELLNFNFADGFVDLDGNRPFRDTLIPCTKVEEVIIQFGDSYPLMFEIKDREEIGEKATEKLWGLIQKYGLESTCVVYSFDDNNIRYFNELSNQEVMTGTSREETEDFIFTAKSGMEYLFRPKSSILAIPRQNSGIQLDKKRVIRSAHRRNMAVFYWTINDYDGMKELIELGADGLITDRADIMQEVLEDLGY